MQSWPPSVPLTGGVARDQRVRRGQRVDRLVEQACLGHPVDEVAAAVAARHPRARADRQVDGPAGVEQVLGHLAAGLAAADDEDGAVGELGRVPVLRRVLLEHPGGAASRSGDGVGRW